MLLFDERISDSRIPVRQNKVLTQEDSSGNVIHATLELLKTAYNENNVNRRFVSAPSSLDACTI